MDALSHSCCLVLNIMHARIMKIVNSLAKVIAKSSEKKRTKHAPINACVAFESEPFCSKDFKQIHNIPTVANVQTKPREDISMGEVGKRVPRYQW